MVDPRRTETFLKRFWGRVQKTDGCWLWTGGTWIQGYGVIGDGNAKLLTHRVSYWIAYGVDPGAQCVLHKCDVRACVRPDHLFLGTKTDNARDRDQKGRSIRGDQCSYALLTEDAVRDIRKRYVKGKVSYETLAREHGVSSWTIRDAVHRRKWKHVV